MSELFKLKLPYSQAITVEDIAKITGRPVSSFVQKDLAAFSASQEELVKVHKEAVRTIINPFYDELSKDLEKNEKKIGELIDLGRFILEYDQPIQIESEGERPDFIVRYNGKRIGVEHTQLFDRPTQHKIGKLSGLLKMTETIIKENYPAVTGLYNPLLLTDQMNDNSIPFLVLAKDKIKQFANKLAEYIVSLYENKAMATPGFVKTIVYYPFDQLSISLGEHFIREEGVMEKLAKRVEEKKNKVDFYKSSNNLAECWLLVVYNMALSSSCFNISFNDLPNGDIKFEKLFLFESFVGSIIEGTLIR